MSPFLAPLLDDLKSVAERLPVMDTHTQSCDPHALVLFEGSAARTNHFSKTRNPKWPATAPRAFHFDITRPFSCAYVGIKDTDTTSFNDDIGRVIIELSTLTSGVVYDCWYELLYKNYKHPRGKRGYVRLRYWAIFDDEKERYRRYVLPRELSSIGTRAPSFAPPPNRTEAGSSLLRD